MAGSEAEVCRLRSCGYFLHPLENEELSDCSHLTDRGQESGVGVGGWGAGWKQPRSLVFSIATFPSTLPHTHGDDLGKTHILTQKIQDLVSHG